MVRRLIISKEAALDIEAARTWLRQPGAGRNASERLTHIRAALLDLRLAPMRWPLGEHPGVREISVAGYRILYELEPDTGQDATAGDVVILRVFGPGQDRTRFLG